MSSLAALEFVPDVQAQEIFAASGLPDLERSVLGFLSTHASALKQLALLDDVHRLLQQVRGWGQGFV